MIDMAIFGLGFEKNGLKRSAMSLVAAMLFTRFLYQNALYNPLVLMGTLKKTGPLLKDTDYLFLNLGVGLAWIIFLMLVKTLYKKTLKVHGFDNVLKKRNRLTQRNSPG